MSGRLKLGQILVNRGLLDPDRLAQALADQQEGSSRLGMTLVRLGFVDEETLIRTLAGQLKLPVARIRGKRVSPDVLECIPVGVAEKHRCLPLFFKQQGGGRVLFVAMEDPTDADALDAIARAAGVTLRAVLVGPTELEEALQRHYHWASLTGEAPDWLSARSPVEPGSAGDAGSESDELQQDPADRDEDWAGEAGSHAEPDALDGEAGCDLETDPEDAADLLATAASARAPWRDELAEADTAPELPESAAHDAGDLDEGAEPGAASPFDAAFDFTAPEAARGAPRAPRPESLDPSIILRALSQLLVEKGVIGRDELVQRLGELAAREAGRG